MDVRLAGTGGSGGWPQPDCRCASCERARSAGRRRAPTQLVVGGVLRIDPGQRSGAGPAAPGYQVERVPGGWAVSAPDGSRLLVGGLGRDQHRAGTAPGAGLASCGTAPHVEPYDIALLDLLEDPAQLGALRRQGLVRATTTVALLHADHRVASAEELARLAGYWGVVVPEDGDVLTSVPGAATAAAPAGADTGTTATATAPASTRAGSDEPPRRVLVLGGARSGKSRHAELRLAAEPEVTYLAAGPYPAGGVPADPDWAGRVAAHQARRPPWWQTVESPEAAATLRSASGAVLFDGAGTWLAAVMDESGAWDADADAGNSGPGERSRLALAQALVGAKVDELIEAWRRTQARVVAVSDEVGSSVHPPTRAGRLFRDQLGWLNQRLAAESEETVLMVAGRALTLPG
jgi:adenosylcobinamide kinase/adenosylcobinamide-phosphate guanylyltransferase